MRLKIRCDGECEKFCKNFLGTKQGPTLVDMLLFGCCQINIHYCIQGLCLEPRTLGKGSLALGKGFAESRSRQRPIGTSFIGKEVFVESHSSSSRQRVCREPNLALGKEK